MKAGERVKLKQSFLNGHKQWNKGEIVKILAFTTIHNIRFAVVCDSENNILKVPHNLVDELKDESINNLAFSIMHTEDLGEIFELAHSIYLKTLHQDLTIEEEK